MSVQSWKALLFGLLIEAQYQLLAVPCKEEVITVLPPVAESLSQSSGIFLATGYCVEEYIQLLPYQPDRLTQSQPMKVGTGYWSTEIMSVYPE